MEQSGRTQSPNLPSLATRALPSVAAAAPTPPILTCKQGERESANVGDAETSIATSIILSMDGDDMDSPWHTPSHTPSIQDTHITLIRQSRPRHTQRRAGMGKRNAKRAHKGCLCILSHNVNSLSNLKLQNCYDTMEQNTTPVLCLQETKIATIRAPPGYRVEHSPRVGKRGGGLATILPSCIPTLQV